MNNLIIFCSVIALIALYFLWIAWLKKHYQAKAEKMSDDQLIRRIGDIIIKQWGSCYSTPRSIEYQVLRQEGLRRKLRFVGMHDKKL